MSVTKDAVTGSPAPGQQNLPSSNLIGVLGGVRAEVGSGGLFSFGGLPSSEGSAGVGKGKLKRQIRPLSM